MASFCDTNRAYRSIGRALSPDYWRRMIRPTLRRSRRVDKPFRFILRELRKAPLIATYRVESGMRICIRHEGIDSFVLDEVFVAQEYRPPPEVDTLLRGLGHPPQILDLGANIGLFGAYILGLFPSARVVAVEPSPDNAAIHRRCIAFNDAGLDWRIVERFAAPEDGVVLFDREGSPLSRVASADDGAVEVRKEDVLPRLAGADLVKIDIEGAEWPILVDPRLAEAPPCALVLEYHSTGCAAGDPQAYARELLVKAGYTLRAGPDRDDLSRGGPGIGLLWAWRRA